jgi:hypothetical protein
VVTSTRLKIVAHGTLAAQTKLLDTMQWEVEHRDSAIEKYMEGFGFATPAAIKLGREREDWLIARYEIIRQKEWGKPPKIARPGFIRHPSIKEFGSSPDWLARRTPVELRTGEGKTRTDQSKHEYAMQRGLLPEDKDQVYTHMMCAGTTLCDYVSYCPEYPDVSARIVIVEVELDIIYSNFLYAELNRFLKHFRAGTRPTVPQVQSGVPSFFD